MERCADPSTRLEIDKDILDYLLYTAIRAKLEDSKSSRHGDDGAGKHAQSDLPLQMVDSFLVMFRAMHPDRHGSEELQFRLRLLKFTVLFTTRYASSHTRPPRSALESVMRQHQERARVFRKGETNRDLDLTSLTEALARPAGERFSITDSSESTPTVSLLDTLPLFMALSAAHLSFLESKITQVWMRLAAGYMAHAVAEQYLVYNAGRPEILREAFAYGFDHELEAQEGSDEWAVNAMFFGDDDIVEGWEEIRREHMHTLLPRPGASLQEHLRTLLAHELPLSAFEDSVLSFLEGLLDAQPKPFLSQLEAGGVDGFLEEEIGALKIKVGLGRN